MTCTIINVETINTKTGKTFYKCLLLLPSGKCGFMMSFREVNEGDVVELRLGVDSNNNVCIRI